MCAGYGFAHSFDLKAGSNLHFALLAALWTINGDINDFG
jgi:hypothetical protein